MPPLRDDDLYDIGFQGLERGQHAQGSEVVDEFRHAASIDAHRHSPTSAAVKPARLANQVMQDALRIGQPFNIGSTGKGKRLTAKWVPGRSPQGRLVEEEPGLLHPHGHNADGGRDRLCCCDLPQGSVDLANAVGARCSFRISMNEQEVTWVQFETAPDAVCQAGRGIG
jgi:hypothetical protein